MDERVPSVAAVRPDPGADVRRVVIIAAVALARPREMPIAGIRRDARVVSVSRVNGQIDQVVADVSPRDEVVRLIFLARLTRRRADLLRVSRTDRVLLDELRTEYELVFGRDPHVLISAY